MRTFDFYDTLVTRMVASPADIFSLVGERLDIPGFRDLRIEAELKARRLHKGEITFNQIYEQLDLAPEIRNAAAELELELEQILLALVLETSSQFKKGDLVISDMYHESHLFAEILSRLMPNKEPGMIFVSGGLGINKAGGELWKMIAAQYPHHRDHIGDNLESDVKQARRHGFRATHFTAANLNRYESNLQSQGLDGSMIAGASRAARLGMTDAAMVEIDRAIVEVFASVISPLLWGFSEWIIRKCKEAGVSEVYFLARDGQLPFRVCSALNAMRGAGLRCHYVYASRHALHLPGYSTIEAAESWLLDNTRVLTLRTLAQRAQVPLGVVVQAAVRHMDTDPARNVPAAERKLLSAIIREPCFVAALDQSCAAAFESAIAYYRAAGLARSEPVAVVDIGWNGRIQASLRSVLEKGGASPERITGLYLCLSRRADDHYRDKLNGFLYEPSAVGSPGPLYDRYRHVFEAALSADHPTTTGFEICDGRARPVFGQPYSETLQARIRLQHAAVNAFVVNMQILESAADRPIVAPVEQVISNLDRFLSDPRRRDGIAFADFDFAEGQIEDGKNSITRILNWRELPRWKRYCGFWPEGTLSASGFVNYARLRNIGRKLKNRVIRIGRFFSVTGK